MTSTDVIIKFMNDYVIEIAEIKVGLATNFFSTYTMCSRYINEGTADFLVKVSQIDIEFEREKSKQDITTKIEEDRKYSDGYLETLAVYRKICEKMVDYDTILMHGSVVAVDGEAYLFTAKSGTGKSTHTRFWREVFGERAIMVNDDKPLLKLTDDGVLACGTPWDGKHRLSTNVCLPLKAICILERGKENEIHPISPQEALPMVFQQTYRPKNMGKYMEIIDKLMQRISFYRLKCNQTPEAAKIAYEGIKP